VSFLGLAGKTFAIFGVSNKKSVGYQTGKLLSEEGATVLYVVHTEARKESLAKLVGDAPIFVCDVEQEGAAAKVAPEIASSHPTLHGFVHSIAFANYSEGAKPFHQTRRRDFLQAVQISCHSLLEISEALRPHLAKDASVVTISISTTKMAAENYGYMAPVKAALDSSVVFLAKSFSAFSEVRFNAVAPSLLKTSSSAGIPGYVDSLLYAEQAIPRKRTIEVAEVASTVAFLLSPRSSGINAQSLIVDAGMSTNYFDNALIKRALRPT
jgi:enoyl-[acyl-carrier protein] reductase I